MSNWLPISALFDFEKGSLQSSKCVPGEYRFITAAEEWKTHIEYSHDCEALAFAMAASGSLGRTHYIKGKFIASDLCFIMTPKKGKKLDLPFYFRVLNFMREDIVKKTATGTSKLSINQTNFGNYEIPYFDYDHQLYFREKIDGISDIKIELINGFSDQSSYLALLRQSILQEAIEGKLTEEWRRKNPVRKGDPDYDAEALLKKISSKLPKRRSENPFLADIVPSITEESQYELPPGWAWLPLGHLGIWATGCGFPKEYQGKSEGEFLFCKVSDMNLEGNETEIINTSNCINYDVMKKIGAHANPPGTVIFPKIGGAIATNKRRIVIKPTIVDNNCSGIQPIGLTHEKWLLMFMQKLDLEKYQSGTSIPAVSQSAISPIRVGLPPPAEQKAIVERVDSLLSMVDELEKQIAERKALAEDLMQSVLREAFEEA